MINMISVALPGNFIAIGQSVNNTFKSVGNSVDPVVVTTIKAQYTVANTNLPSRTAFDSMFLMSIVTSLMIIAITLFIGNYRLAQPQEKLEFSGSQ